MSDDGKKISEQLTAKQKRVFEFVKRTIHESKTPPTYRDICDEFGFKSSRAAGDYLLALERKGYLRRTKKGMSRGLTLLRDEDAVSGENTQLKKIPILGEGDARQPHSFFQNSKKSIAVSNWLFSEEQLFAAQIQDDSMIESGIEQGDFVICAQTPFQSGELAAFAVEGVIVVRKTLVSEQLTELLPTNKGFPKIKWFNNDSDIIALGVYRGVIRSAV